MLATARIALIGEIAAMTCQRHRDDGAGVTPTRMRLRLSVYKVARRGLMGRASFAGRGWSDICAG